MKIISNLKNLPQGVKASIAFFLANIITKGISYLTTPIFTRLLSLEQYGQVTLFNTWFQVFGIIAMFCLMNGVFNNGLLEYENDRDSYSFSILILSNVITVCFSALLLCVYPLIKSIIKLDFPFIVLMCLLWFVQPAYNFWTARQRYEFKYKAVFFWSILIAVLSPLVAIILLLVFKDADKLYLRIFGAEMVLAIVYLGFFFYLGIKNRFKVKTKFWKEAFLFNLPLIPHYLSIFLLSSSDKIMISNLVSDSATAIYDVGYTVSQISLIIWSAVNASLIPFTYEKCREGKYEDIDKVTKPLLMIFAVASIVVIMLAPEVVSFMATSDYRDAIYVVPPLVGGVFFQVQYYIFANVIFYYRKPVFAMIGSVTAVVLNILLNYLCIKRWGYVAAGYTTIVCYAVQALIDYFAMKKVSSNKIYNMKFILFLSILVVTLSLLSLLLYDVTPIARYVIILVIGIVIFIFRKKVIEIFKVVKKG